MSNVHELAGMLYRAERDTLSSTPDRAVWFIEVDEARNGGWSQRGTIVEADGVFQTDGKEFSSLFSALSSHVHSRL